MRGWKRVARRAGENVLIAARLAADAAALTVALQRATGADENLVLRAQRWLAVLQGVARRDRACDQTEATLPDAAASDVRLALLGRGDPDLRRGDRRPRFGSRSFSRDAGRASGTTTRRGAAASVSLRLVEHDSPPHPVRVSPRRRPSTIVRGQDSSRGRRDGIQYHNATWRCGCCGLEACDIMYIASSMIGILFWFSEFCNVSGCTAMLLLFILLSQLLQGVVCLVLLLLVLIFVCYYSGFHRLAAAEKVQPALRIEIAVQLQK